MIYCGGPICLGQGYNMPRKRGSNAISQKITLRWPIFLVFFFYRVAVQDILVVATVLFILEESAKTGRCKILAEHCFQCEHPEGGYTSLSLRLTRKYSESDKISGIGIPISAIEKWRNVATGGVLYCDGRLSRWIESE